MGMAGGISALVAIPALIGSAWAIAMFFGGRGDKYGPINDVLVALALLLLIPAAFALPDLSSGPTPPWLTVLTALGIAGMAIAAIGQLLLVASVISLNTSFVTGGTAMVPLLAWLCGVAIFCLTATGAPASVGWLAIAVLALAAVLTVVSSVRRRDAVVWGLAAALVGVLSLWLGFLGVELIMS